MESASTGRWSRLQPVLAYLSRHRLSVIVLLVAFLVRFIYLLDYSESPFFQVHIADALYHEQWAKRIVQGDLFSLKMPGVLYKAPLYPYFLAFCYLFSGGDDFLPMLVQVVLGAFSCLLLFSIGKRYFSVQSAFIGALIFSLYFPAVYFSAQMEIPALSIFLTLLSFYLLVGEPKTWPLVLGAFVFGLSLLALPTNLLLLPLYLLVLFGRQGERRRRIGRVSLFAAVAFATVLPCTIRNWKAGGHLTLISANGGINLYIGNNEHYDQTVGLQPGYAFEDFYDEPRRVAGAASFSDRDRYWYRKTFDFISKHPAKEAVLLLKKAVLYFADYQIYRNTDINYAKKHSIYNRIPFVPSSLILACGLVGLILMRRQRKSLELMAFGVLLALPCVVFFVTERYRLPSMGIWALFAGVFVMRLTEAFKKRAWRSSIAPLAGAATVAVVSNLNLLVVKNPEYRPHLNLGFIYETKKEYPQALAQYATALDLVHRIGPRDHGIESELYARMGNVRMLSGDLGAAQKDFERAVAVNPNSAPAYSYLGTLYDRLKHENQAIEMFRRALEINPWDVVSLHNLGLAYLDQGKLDEAKAQFERAIELAPENAAAHSDLAYVYAKQGRYELSEAEAKKALYYNPKIASARYNLAYLYTSTGRVDEAMAEYREIIRLAPAESSNAHNQLGVYYAKKNDLARAVEQWQKAVEVDRNNFNAHVNLARAKSMMRR